MARSKINSNKEAKLKAKEQDEEYNAIPVDLGSKELTEYSGGSIDNLAITTPEFKKWLTIQQSINPFIAKHVTAAPEHYTEQKMVGNAKMVDGNDLKELLDSIEEGTENYKPVGIDGYTGGERDPNDETFNNFMDMVISENAVLMLPDYSIDDLESFIEESLKMYYDDEDYQPKIDIREAIENKRQFLLEQQEKHKLLTNNTEIE
jgi:hypothetical protein